MQHPATLHHTATHCNTTQIHSLDILTYRHPLQNTGTLQHTATHYTTLQHKPNSHSLNILTYRHPRLQTHAMPPRTATYRSNSTLRTPVAVYVAGCVARCVLIRHPWHIYKGVMAHKREGVMAHMWMHHNKNVKMSHGTYMN